jgi:uncharacterized protein YndB with AHSA1/START domain
VNSKVLVSLRVKASPERAFAAFVGEIGVWFQANPMFAFTPRDPGVLAFEPGEGGRLTETLASGKVFEIGKIRAWEPPRRLVFGWRQAAFAEGQDTEVEVRFETVGDETRVTVEHTGWDSVPAVHVARHGFANAVFLTRHAEWWQALLASYKHGIGDGDGRVG